MYIQNSTVRTSNNPAVGSVERSETCRMAAGTSRGFVWTCPGADLILFFSIISVFSMNIIFHAEAVDNGAAAFIRKNV